MFALKISLVLIFSLKLLELSTKVLADLSTDARSALDSLRAEITHSARTVSITGGNLWYIYTRDLPQVVEELLRNETNKLNFVLSNLNVYANNVVGGIECLESINTSVTVDPQAAENLVFTNLRWGAFLDVTHVELQYGDMHNQWLENCLRNQDYCEGTSRAIIVEANKLVRKLRIIPYGLLTEIHVLGYQVTINIEDARTRLREQYNRAIEDATTCLASKIKENKQYQSGSPTDISASEQSISEAYADLVSIIKNTNSTARNDVMNNFVTVSLQLESDFIETSLWKDSAYSATNETINALFREAEALNANYECGRGDVDNIFNSIVDTVNEIVYHTLQRLLNKTFNDINDVASEIYSIGLEVDFCSGDIQCDYLLEKINSKKIEISQRIQQVKDSSVVLFHQLNVLQRASSARIIRDALERAETEIIDLKSCIQYALQYAVID